ncbi:hypothetical protein [Psittacine adenovirus 2]|uniref:Uncharacterized protein n=1 Tax=Psittacine adenovirus 2 TaxID=1301246 RepID=A0ABX8SNB5_9ADEN|nr:hypothetical protein [Psittacine adenovirus 2]QZW33263.1 ORF24 hypothetical protein [Psittacine siadenovirus F]QZW33709.1 ORF24 hypothetical protein [Psittacine adenovirus 2]WGL41032.1 hypothetical protein [Psittacine siadenovirus F]WGL41057.1 hypothetical protein [Psittacine siadenovirus F]
MTETIVGLEHLNIFYIPKSSLEVFLPPGLRGSNLPFVCNSPIVIFGKTQEDIQIHCHCESRIHPLQCLAWKVFCEAFCNRLL